MMIACLGWGSLVWDPRELPIRKEWFKDGPFVPVEFTRQSTDGRITLVIEAHAMPMRVLWALMVPADLQVAERALCRREGIRDKDCSSGIGSWQHEQAAPANIPGLSTWAEGHGVDAVVWTALGSRFKNEDRSPSADEVIEYLRELRGSIRECAKRYVEQTPAQIDTDYRREIEAVLGWTCKQGVSL